MCVNFIHKWRDLQFKVDSERQIFWETFRGNFINFIAFARNLLRGNWRRNTFRISFWCLAWDSNPGFLSNKPTHYLLDHAPYALRILLWIKLANIFFFHLFAYNLLFPYIYCSLIRSNDFVYPSAYFPKHLLISLFMVISFLQRRCHPVTRCIKIIADQPCYNVFFYLRRTEHKY